MRFADLAKRDLIAMIAGGASGIALAVAGRGLGGLVAQALVSSAVGTLLLWKLSGHRFSLKDCDRDALAELWTFGSRITAFGIFKYLVRNVDALLIGYVLGPRPLGSYLFAQRIVMQPVAGLEAGIGTFVFARASAFQQDRIRLAGFFLAVFNLLNVLLVAWALVVSIAGPPLLRMYFGPVWDDSLSLIWILALVVITHAAITPIGQMMKALGHPGWLLGWSIGFTVMLVAALLAGLHWGLRGAVLGIATTHGLSLGYIYVTARRYLGVSKTDWVSAAGPVYAAATVGLLGVAAVGPFLADKPLVAAGTFVGCVGFALVAAWWRSPVFAVLKEPV